MVMYLIRRHFGTDRMITISNYESAEAKAIARASYPVIRAFRPAAFTQANFPARVSEEQELIRYADCMYELADRTQFYERDLYSDDEASLMLALSEKIEQLTTTHFGRPVQPFMCLFPPIRILRAIDKVAKERPLTIYEIGPGSGFLGAYAILRGHTYRAIDNTQALYLWQDRLFEHLVGADYKNFASADCFDPSVAPKVSSIPWWQFAEFYKSPPDADIVVCEAALGEMDTFAANYVLRLAGEMLKDSNVGAFIYCNIGEQRLNSLSYIEGKLSSIGFRKYESDGATIHALKSNVGLMLPSIKSPFRRMRPAKDFLSIDQTKLLESYAFFDFIKLHG